MKIKVLIVLSVISFTAHAQQGVDQLVREWKDSVRMAMEQEMVHQRFVAQKSDTMWLWWNVYGEEPADGRSLWISLHGGGGCPPEINNQQWSNQTKLYRPKEGVYVAPRAPWDLWNMWCKEEIDGLYEQLIRGMVAYYNVNPDKVYLMGYSAGGDGVWRMAPRMADHWAAASMMAGHPGGVSLLNLRNLPFMIWMGAEDAAYDRNLLAVQRGKELDELQQNDPEGYIHETHIVEGAGHWMNRKDTAAVAWMSAYKRNPFPKRIVWRQEERVRENFYWLEAPSSEMKPGMTVEVRVEDNLIDISRCDYSRLTLYLSDALIDLQKPVVVRIAGRKVFSGKVKPSVEKARYALYRRQDPRYATPVILNVKKR